VLFLYRCEHYEIGQCGHLFLRNLSEYNITYLDALIRDDRVILGEVETYAARRGYGPLTTCTFLFACRDQKQLCRK